MDFVKMKEIQLEIERGKEMKPLEAWKNILDYHELHLHDRPLDEELGVLQHALNRLEQDDSMREITLKELNRLDKIDSIDLDEALADVKLIEDEILAHNLVGLTSLINLIKQIKDE